MTIKQTSLAAFTFSVIPGIINILGIKMFGIVLTNVTGHFSGAVMQLGGQSYDEILLILSYILIYWIGSFFASSCFIYGNQKENNFLKALPLLINLGIMLWALKTNNIPFYSFFFVTSVQNSFGANHSQNEIRPSQITGVIMASGLDIAKYFFSDCPPEIKQTYIQSFSNKMLNVTGFVMGGTIAFFYTTILILWIPVIFYSIVAFWIIQKKL